MSPGGQFVVSPDTQRQIHPHARRNRDHRRSSAAASRASTAGSIRSATRSTRPLPSTISTSPSGAPLPSVLSGGAGAAGSSSLVSRTAGTSGATRTAANPAAAVTAARSPRHLRDPALGNFTDQPNLLLARPRSTPANAGDDLHPLESHSANTAVCHDASALDADPRHQRRSSPSRHSGQGSRQMTLTDRSPGWWVWPCCRLPSCSPHERAS